MFLDSTLLQDSVNLVTKLIGRDGSLESISNFNTLYSLVRKKVEEEQINSSKIIGAHPSRILSVEDLLYVFNTEQDLSTAPIKSINKAKSRLLNTVDSLDNLNNVINSIIDKFKKNNAGYSNNIYQICAIIYISLIGINVISQNDEAIIKRLLQSISSTGGINYLLFVCPPTDFSFLTSFNSEDYLLAKITSNTLISRQESLLRAIKESSLYRDVSVNLLTFIGDDDGIYLLPYCTLPDFSINEKRQVKVSSNLNRGKLRESIEGFMQFGKIKSGKPKDKLFNNPEVLSLADSGYSLDLWQIFYQISFNPRLLVKQSEDELFTLSDIEEEVERMNNLFKNYYSDLVKIKGRMPSEEELLQMVYKKFALYSIQGIKAYLANPNLILIQSEQPALLRDKMINGGLRLCGLPLIPSIHI